VAPCCVIFRGTPTLANTALRTRASRLLTTCHRVRSDDSGCNMNDIETIAASVFYSARDGRLKRLQLLLEGKSAMENAKLLKTTTTGATPLLMACRHGHYDIALYLIKRHKVDIEQTGSGNTEFLKVWSADPQGSASPYQGVRGANPNPTQPKYRLLLINVILCLKALSIIYIYV